MGDTGQTQLPAGTYGRSIHDRLLIDLSWASSHLEGNTHSRLHTRELIEHGRIATGKDAVETQMILNHEAAIELLVDLFVWAYERSTQEYLVIKQDLVAPDPLRLAWRKVIKETIRSVVTQPERATLDIIKEELSRHELAEQKTDCRSTDH